MYGMKTRTGIIDNVWGTIMALKLEWLCDECGDLASGMIELATGRIEKDGLDIGQTVWLCEKHWPDDGVMSQPKNCKYIRFYWPIGSSPER